MKIVNRLESPDKISYKFLQETDDGNIIETSYFDKEENIICISTQIGCPMGCVFCATGQPIDDEVNPKARFVRNLTCEEIYGQVVNVIESEIIRHNTSKSILLSYMGMGEPFINYDNVVCSIKKLSADYKGRIKQATLATTGVFSDKIKKMAEEKFNIPVKIQLSLHAPTDELRRKIMPNVKPIKEALEAMRFYSEATNQILKINYVLIRDINDSGENAKDLAKLIHPYRNSLMVKLMVLNEIGGYKQSQPSRFAEFETVLNDSGINTEEFVGDGKDINASCGQLRRHYYKS